jgi:hypothetical protein
LEWLRDELLMASKTTSILSATVAAAAVAGASYVVLGLCLAEPLEDVRPQFIPLVNVGVLAILLAVAIVIFRFVFRSLRNHDGSNAG